MSRPLGHTVELSEAEPKKVDKDPASVDIRTICLVHSYIETSIEEWTSLLGYTVHEGEPDYGHMSTNGI